MSVELGERVAVRGGLGEDLKEGLKGVRGKVDFQPCPREAAILGDSGESLTGVLAGARMIVSPVSPRPR